MGISWGCAPQPQRAVPCSSREPDARCHRASLRTLSCKTRGCRCLRWSSSSTTSPSWFSAPSSSTPCACHTCVRCVPCAGWQMGLTHARVATAGSGAGAAGGGHQPLLVRHVRQRQQLQQRRLLVAERQLHAAGGAARLPAAHVPIHHRRQHRLARLPALHLCHPGLPAAPAPRHQIRAGQPSVRRIAAFALARRGADAFARAAAAPRRSSTPSSRWCWRSFCAATC